MLGWYIAFILLILLLCSLTYLLYQKNKIISNFKNRDNNNNIENNISRYKLAFDATNDGIWDIDLVTNKVFINRRWKEMLGYNDKELYYTDDYCFSLIHHDDIERTKKALFLFINGETDSYELKFRLKCKSGQYKWILTRAVGCKNHLDKMVRVIGTHTDIQELMELYNLIDYQRIYVDTIVENSNTIILISNKQGKILSISKYAQKVTGLKDKDAILKTWEEVFNFNNEEYPFHNYFITNDNKDFLTDFICKIKCKNNKEIAILFKNSFINDVNGVELILSIGIDVTDSEKTKEKIDNLAYIDQLTKLPNRYYLYKKLDEFLFNASNKSNAAILFIDLDNFKNINDIHGHEMGDRVLKEITKRFKSLDERLFISRIGGDEFVILIENFESYNKIDYLCQNIINSIVNPVIMDDKTMYVGCSIGISLYPEHSKNKENLLKYADTAMYEAKEGNKNNYKYFNTKLWSQVIRKNTIANDLRKAVNNDEIMIQYQPIINVNNNRIYSLEALARWNNKSLGYISPVEFIKIAEDNGYIVELGNLIINKIFKDIEYWDTLEYNDFYVSINISFIQLQEVKFLSNLLDLFNKTNVNPNRIIFEITENALLSDLKKNIKILNKLCNLGVKIALDDFGTGYSSMSYLKDLPIHIIKIDRNYIKDIDKDIREKKLVDSMIYLGNNLDLKVIAEGVENIQQKLILLEKKCYYQQGYFYNKPLIVDELIKIFNNNNEKVTI